MIHDNFIQVLLFRDARDSYKVGPAVWAAFKEVAALYNFDQARANFRRCFLSKYVPSQIDQEIEIDQDKVSELLGSQEWWNSVRTSSEVSERLFSEAEQSGLKDTLGEMDDVIDDLVSEESHETVDKTLLLKEVRKLIGNVPSSVPLVLVTDQELTPPPSWNYIIWDYVKGEPSFVVSIKPTDPRYWGIRTKRPNPIIKQRVRAACCSTVGQVLGFSRCSNPECFLFKPVESVSDLDDMCHLGREHEVPKLSGMGYRADQQEQAPSEVAPLVHLELENEGDLKNAKPK